MCLRLYCVCASLSVCAGVADSDKSSHCATATCKQCYEEKQRAHDNDNVVTQWFVLQLGDFLQKNPKKRKAQQIKQIPSCVIKIQHIAA